MPMTLKRPFYRGRLIGSVDALARALGVEPSRLRRLGSRADRLYEGPITVRKPGRKPRTVFSASPALRDVHQRILDRILKRVTYPTYLMGGLEGRSYIDNAHGHSGGSVLFGEDVDAFYPSIPRERIARIFMDVFHFAPEVANLLAQLTSRKGQLVQGGVASTHLGNLALYRTEPELERQMREEGLQYSRFVDDIHVSSKGALSNQARTRVVSNARLPGASRIPTEAKEAVCGFGKCAHACARTQR
jgi:hypothetical protein